MKDSIYVNGRFLNQPITGVQRYAYELINQFDNLLDKSENFKNVQIYCLVPPEVKIKTPWQNITITPIGLNRGNIWEQLDLPLYLKGKFLFSPTNTGPFIYRNQVITIHDASVFAVPHTYSIPFRIKHKLIYTTLSHVAKSIITDSKFSQTELAHYLKLPITRFKVIHLAGDHINNIEPDTNALEKYGLKEKEYILIVGSQSLHKNLTNAMEASNITNSQVKFVFIGGNFNKVFNKQSTFSNFRNATILGYINSNELKSLYQNALGFLFPSHYEGFGLPILEAMHCGCPVICAHTASLPEVAGEAALFFDPNQSSEIAQAVDRIYFDADFRNSLVEKGYRRAVNFSWSSTAENTLKSLLGSQHQK